MAEIVFGENEKSKREQPFKIYVYLQTKLEFYSYNGQNSTRFARGRALISFNPFFCPLNMRRKVIGNFDLPNALSVFRRPIPCQNLELQGVNNKETFVKLLLAILEKLNPIQIDSAFKYLEPVLRSVVISEFSKCPSVGGLAHAQSSDRRLPAGRPTGNSVDGGHLCSRFLGNRAGDRK